MNVNVLYHCGMYIFLNDFYGCICVASLPEDSKYNLQHKVFECSYNKTRFTDSDIEEIHGCIIKFISKIEYNHGAISIYCKITDKNTERFTFDVVVNEI